jgi:hypothetical protein
VVVKVAAGLSRELWVCLTLQDDVCSSGGERGGSVGVVHMFKVRNAEVCYKTQQESEYTQLRVSFPSLRSSDGAFQSLPGLETTPG